MAQAERSKGNRNAEGERDSRVPAGVTVDVVVFIITMS